MKKQVYKVGGVYEIPLGDGLLGYTRVLMSPTMAFYDLMVMETPSIESIVTCPVIFKIFVMRNAVTSGRWQLKGVIPLEEELKEPTTFFKQDALRSDLFFLYRDGQDIPVSKAQCQGLERAAVWSPEHVEDRLRDYFSGRPNRWVELLRLPD